MSGEEGNGVMEMAKVLIPVATFLAGYGLSEWGRVRGARKKIRNMKKILFRELSENYKHLNKARSEATTDEQGELGMTLQPEQRSQVEIVAAMGVSRNISHTMYDAYLDRIDALEADELEKVFEAYVFLAEFMEFVKNYPEGAEGIAMTLHTAHEKCADAIRLFDGGEAFLEAQKQYAAETFKKAALELQKRSEQVHFDPKEIVTVQESAVSSMLGIEALRQLLFEKGIITEGEFIGRYKKLSREVKRKGGG